MLEGEYFSSNSDYDNVDWFVNEVKNWKIKWRAILRTLLKINYLVKKVKKKIERLTFVDFMKKNFESDKVRDNCHLTGQNKGAARYKCNGIVKHKTKYFNTNYSSQF